MSEYQSNYKRPDKSAATKKSPNRDPRVRTSSSSSSWDNQGVQYSQTHPPNSYQHLQQNMYSNSTQYPGQTYYTGYENYSYNPYQYTGSNQQYIGGTMPSSVPVVPPEGYPQGSWPAPPPTETSATSAGVVEELNKQKAGLVKERETYEERVSSLRKKLQMLVDQKEQLSSKHSSDRETVYIIKENTKLQVEIQSKIKDANNVIEILSDLIGDTKEAKQDTDESSSYSANAGKQKTEKVNYKHYDPEIHWCRMCDVFPQSAKELLVHLHCKKHQETVQEEAPWHKMTPEAKFPVYEAAPIRRLPIKGLQFFVASTAWYCRLCDVWIGDLHCASQHLMSVSHSQNYTNFVEQNPHWEIEWLKDREKALERVKRSKNDSDSEDEQKRRRHKDKYSPSAKDKKRKKRKRRRQSSDSSSSSSSSSSSEDESNTKDKTKSIRVAMRNKMNEDKWGILNKLVEEERKRQVTKSEAEAKLPPPPPVPEDNLIGQWVPVSEPVDKDKQLLDSLKVKLRQKQEAEKLKLQEEARQREEREAEIRQREKEEHERKQREKEALERQELRRKDERKMSLKIKEQVVKVKNRDNYRRRSISKSPEHYRRSRSNSSERKFKNGRSFEKSPNMRYNKEKVEEPKREKKPPPPPTYKKLPFIGRMPLFKNQKGKRPEEEKKEKEIQKEDYDIPRKTRFQPGNLARAFLPEPDVVCFPKLSSYPPLAPPPPALTVKVPEPPKISKPVPPPPPKIVAPKETVEEQAEAKDGDEDYNTYEDASGENMYQYSGMDFNMYEPPPESFNFMQVQNENESSVPRAHVLPLEPPPLPPDDPNDDLALLGISSDDMAAQMF